MALAKRGCDSSELGGYDLMFVEEPPDSLKCLICLLVVKDPQQHGDCGKLFCNSCIAVYKLRQVYKTKKEHSIKVSCPNCRQKLTTFKDGKSAREVNSLQVMCENFECLWKGELRSLDKHIQTCGYALVFCPNGCANELLRQDLESHLKSKCSRRSYKCRHCGDKGEFEDMVSAHLEICPKVEIKCLNLGCRRSIVRSNMANHKSTCKYEPVPCKYSVLGCDESLLRKNLKEHEDSETLHVQITQEKVLKQNETIKMLEKLTSRFIILRMTSFKEKLQTNDVFCTGPFYSEVCGYKLNMKVFPNDNGYVSIGIYLMKGEYDDSLIWPFTGTVTTELLNQLEDKSHHKHEITFIAEDEVSQRVELDRAAMGSGWGKLIPQFISRADLDYRADTHCQYLKDDTLVFRVSVRAPDNKPWLQPGSYQHLLTGAPITQTLS